MDSDTIIGIDLGTTNSEVAILSGGKPEVVREDGDAILPSCVGLDEAGNVIVGGRARNQAAVAPERTVLSIKRLMGSGERVPMGDGGVHASGDFGLHSQGAQGAGGPRPGP